MARSRTELVALIALLLVSNFGFSLKMVAQAEDSEATQSSDDSAGNKADAEGKKHKKQPQAKPKKKPKDDDGGYYSFYKQSTPAGDSQSAPADNALDDALGTGAAKRPTPKKAVEPSRSAPAGDALEDALGDSGSSQKQTSKKKSKNEDEDGYYHQVPKYVAPPMPTDVPQSAPSAIEAKPDPQSYLKKLFMWKGKRDDQVVYVLGTIDVGQKSFYPMPDDIDRILAESRTLILDFAAGDSKSGAALEKLRQSKGTYAAGDGLNDHLSQETKGLLQWYLNWAGESMSLYNQYKPWLVDEQITSAAMRREGYRPELSINEHLIEEAKKSGKKVIELETAESQASRQSGAPEAEQDVMLRLSLQKLGELRNFVGNVTLAWRNGDAAALEGFVTKDARQSKSSLAAYNKVMGAHNIAMCEKVDAVTKTGGTSFVAVDAANVVGDNGLLAMLQKKGFTFEQVVQSPISAKSSISGKLRRLPLASARCVLMMPGDPDVSYSNIPLNNGSNLQATNYCYPEFGGAFYFGFVSFPYPVDLSDPKVSQVLLNGMASTFAATANLAREKSVKSKGSGGGTASGIVTRKVISQQPIDVQGHPGLEIVAQDTAKNGEMQCHRQRIVLGDQMIYTMDAMGSKAWSDSQSVTDFIGSLSITQPNAGTFTTYSGASSINSTDDHNKFHDDMEEEIRQRKSMEEHRRSNDDWHRGNNAYHQRNQTDRGAGYAD